MNRKETPHAVRRTGRVLARLGSADCVALHQPDATIPATGH